MEGKLKVEKLKQITDPVLLSHQEIFETQEK
jgi:hypothetical protein